MTRDELASACRTNDLRAELGGMPNACKALGVDPADMVYIAEQRALRLVLKEDMLPIPTVPQAIELTPGQLKRLKRYTAASVDGIAIGLSAAHAWCLRHIKEVGRDASSD